MNALGPVAPQHFLSAPLLIRVGDLHPQDDAAPFDLALKVICELAVYRPAQGCSEGRQRPAAEHAGGDDCARRAARGDGDSPAVSAPI